MVGLSLPLGPNAITAVILECGGAAPTPSTLTVSAHKLSAATFPARRTTQLEHGCVLLPGPWQSKGLRFRWFSISNAFEVKPPAKMHVALPLLYQMADIKLEYVLACPGYDQSELKLK
jgi:hypothetical protein